MQSQLFANLQLQSLNISILHTAQGSMSVKLNLSIQDFYDWGIRQAWNDLWDNTFSPIFDYQLFPSSERLRDLRREDRYKN